MALKNKIRKKNITLCVFSNFCLNQGYKQCTIVTNNYHIVYSHIILNASTFSRLWAKQFWSQYPEYQPNFVDYSFQIIMTLYSSF